MTLLGDRPLSAATRVAGCIGHAATARLSRVVERDPLLWVFGAQSGEAFTDNAKYLFLHVCAHYPEIRSVWLSANRSVVTTLRSHGYEAYYTYSPRGLDVGRRAGVTFLTHRFGDVCASCSGGALAVMLWHGTPLKRISWDWETGYRTRSVATRAATTYTYRRIDLLTAASEATRESFASAFRIDPDVIVSTGYPRNDVFAREIPGSGIGIDEGLRERVRSLASEGPLWLYLPTYRRIGESAGVVEHVDFAALDSFLAERGAFLLVKAHPFERLALDGDLQRVIRLPTALDVYPLLSATDGLLTDYSSILFDYLLLDRPLVFYPYDVERYRAERGFYYDYESVTPGPVATDFEGLLGALDAAMTEDANGTDDNGYASERARLRERFCREDENRSEAVCEAVFERLNA